MVEAREVSRVYKSGTPQEVRALDRVSLQVAPGEFVLLTGPSGSGKSTLLGLLGALDYPTLGQVFFEGSDLGKCSNHELARIRRRCGFVFQAFSLIPRLPVWENITYPLIPRGVSKARRISAASEFLDLLHMADKFHARPEELSGGEKQRVAVARALVGKPSVLFADEPTSSLDAVAGQGLLEMLGRIQKNGTTVILASHDPRALAWATTVYELESGRLKALSPFKPGDTGN